MGSNFLDVDIKFLWRALRQAGYRFFALTCAVFGAFQCSNRTSTQDLLDANFSMPATLTVAPRSFEILTGQSQAITVVGGQKPYTYKVLTGVGSISASGVFTSSSAGIATIQADDSSGLSVVSNGVVRATAKDPASLTSVLGNLRLWLKADALALADGAAVTTWPDSSGNGVVVSQGTPVNQPTYKTGVYNGKPTIRFNGLANPNSSKFSLTLPMSTDMTLFVVATPSSVANAYMIAGDGAGSTPSIISNWVGRAYEYFSNMGITTERLIFKATASGVNVMAFRQTGMTNILLSYNGVLQVETLPVSSLTPSNFVLIGYGPGGAGAPYGGDIAEVIVYNKIGRAHV